jgi:hypothetical protein
MAITVSGTTITFNDATTQTTAGLVSGGALGTPSSGTLTNCTSVPVNQATGTLAVANGGTGGTTQSAARAGIGAGTGNGNGNGNGNGTVTSVATGNGLSGGTITSTGTLAVACPTFNSVGSYSLAGNDGNKFAFQAGSNYSAGSATSFLQAYSYYAQDGFGLVRGNNLSGTWKWMCQTSEGSLDNPSGLACRVS